MQEKRKYKKEATFFLICLLAIFCGVFVPFARVAPAIAPIDSKILVEGETISGELKKQSGVWIIHTFPTILCRIGT